MVKITLQPGLARFLVAERESERQQESFKSLERAIVQGEWNNVPPIWVTPNFIINGLFCGLRSGEWHPTLKPLIVYNGHHRKIKAIEHKLPLTAYVRYTPGNPKMPDSERLEYDMDGI